MAPVMQSAMLVLTGSSQTGWLTLEGQQKFLGRTTRVKTSTQQPSVNRAAGSPQIATPLPLILEALGGLEPVLATHSVQKPVISD